MFSLEIAPADVGSWIAGLLMSAVRTRYEYLVYVGSVDHPDEELPRALELEFAGVAVDDVLEGFPPSLREQLRGRRDELAAHIIGAEVHSG